MSEDKKSSMTHRERAEELYESIGGDLCICQRADVPHWCERCQGRIQLIREVLASAACQGETSPQVTAHIQALSDLCEEVWLSHRDKDDAEYNECEKDECAWCEETKRHIAALKAPGEATGTRFDELRALVKGWDGYKADPLDPVLIDRAEQFLRGVNIVPCGDGGVQLEWHTKEVDVEIEFEPDGTVDVWSEPKGEATGTRLVVCSRNCAHPRRDRDQEHPGICECGGWLTDVIREEPIHGSD